MRADLVCGLVLAAQLAWPAFAQQSANPIAHFHAFTAPKITGGQPEGWSTFTPRDEIAPRFSVDSKGGRTGAGALRIDSGGKVAAFGGWRTQISGLTGNRAYRFSAWYRAENIPNERRSLIARLEWLDEKGKAVRPPDYALDVAREGKWTRVEYATVVPEKTRSVAVQLALGFAAKGRVWWDDIQLREEPALPKRLVRTMTVFHRPRGTKSAAESVEQFCRLVEDAAAQKPDLICLPEGITVVGTGKRYADVSEPLAGPTAARLGALAKKLNSHVVAGIYEREGKIIYNTALLIGRDGRLIGSYRKTHLPREEWEVGITPGDHYPVFQTDFGKVGLIICWDLQFPEPSRAMAAKGAEMLLLPIWGGSETLARARAIENCLYLVSATYDMRSFIVDPTGQVLAEATKEQPVVTVELDLNARFYQPWLGDMKTRTWKERRPDLPLD